MSYFNGQEDLLNVVNDFCSYIHENIKNYSDNLGNRRTFTLDGIQKIEDSKRIIHGFFDSALTGDEMKIKDNKTNNLIYDVKKRDLQSRNFFFLIYVPKNSKYAYLIVQKKSNHGVKNVLENSFNDFLKIKGFLDYRISLEYAPDYNLLNRLMEYGEIKEVRLISNKIFSSFDEQFENKEGLINDGTFEELFKFNKTSRIDNFRDYLFKLYKANFKDYEQIQISNKLYDEISFLITLDGLSKTFYVKNKAKIRSDADVTNDLEFQDGEPSKESLLKVSWKLIMAVLGNFDDEEKLAS